MSAEFLAPEVIKKVFVELKDLTQSPPEGIKVIINEEDVTDVQALIDGPDDTPFAGGVFKMKLKLGSEYPQAPPKGFFLTKIFHPNVSSKGEICVNTLKKDWKPDMGIRHLLLTIKCLLMQPNPESALNEEAGKLLLDAYEDYFKHAQLMTQIHALKKAPAATPASNTNTSTAEGVDAKKARVEKENVPRNKPVTAAATSAANNKLKKSLKRL